MLAKYSKMPIIQILAFLKTNFTIIVAWEYCTGICHTFLESAHLCGYIDTNKINKIKTVGVKLRLLRSTKILLWLLRSAQIVILLLRSIEMFTPKGDYTFCCYPYISPPPCTGHIWFCSHPSVSSLSIPSLPNWTFAVNMILKHDQGCQVPVPPKHWQWICMHPYCENNKLIN